MGEVNRYSVAWDRIKDAKNLEWSLGLHECTQRLNDQERENNELRAQVEAVTKERGECRNKTIDECCQLLADSFHSSVPSWDVIRTLKTKPTPPEAPE